MIQLRNPSRQCFWPGDLSGWLPNSLPSPQLPLPAPRGAQIAPVLLCSAHLQHKASVLKAHPERCTVDQAERFEPLRNPTRGEARRLDFTQVLRTLLAATGGAAAPLQLHKTGENAGAARLQQKYGMHGLHGRSSRQMLGDEAGRAMFGEQHGLLEETEPAAAAGPCCCATQGTLPKPNSASPTGPSARRQRTKYVSGYFQQPGEDRQIMSLL